MQEQSYLNAIHASFAVADEDRAIFDRVIRSRSLDRLDILDDLAKLTQRCGLAYALMALYRQQVNCGFVLADPLKREGKERKRFFDERSGIEFHVLWQPDRELRKDHQLLIQRGVVAESADETRLINRDKDGKPCYLCRDNIGLQNPAEVLSPLELAGEQYFAGANFAYITNNHFTIMSAEHRPQLYRKKVLTALNDFVQQTDGQFRAIFNGLAGASILWHEHLQATSEKFPIEDIRIKKVDILYEDSQIRVSRPFYYVPLWIVEGISRTRVEDTIDRIIKDWHCLNTEHHTENVISAMTDKRFRIFILLRDVRKLAGTGKVGAMAAFECGGYIVLSYEPFHDEAHEINEWVTFQTASLETVKRLLADVAPQYELTRATFQKELSGRRQ